MEEESQPKTSVSKRYERSLADAPKIDPNEPRYYRLLKLYHALRWGTPFLAAQILNEDHHIIQVDSQILFKAYYVDRLQVKNLLTRISGTTSIPHAISVKGAKIIGRKAKNNYRAKEANPLGHNQTHTPDHDLIVGKVAAINFAYCHREKLPPPEWENEVRLPALFIPYYKKKLKKMECDAECYLTHGGQRELFYDEVETGSIPVRRSDWEQSSWEKKVLNYIALWRSGKRFRVRVYVQNFDDMLRRLACAAQHANGLNIFWFTTVANIDEALKPGEDGKLHPDDYFYMPIWLTVKDVTLDKDNELVAHGEPQPLFNAPTL